MFGVEAHMRIGMFDAGKGNMDRKPLPKAFPGPTAPLAPPPKLAQPQAQHVFPKHLVRCSLPGTAWYRKYPLTTDWIHFRVSAVDSCMRRCSCALISFSLAAMRVPMVFRRTTK